MPRRTLRKKRGYGSRKLRGGWPFGSCMGRGCMNAEPDIHVPIKNPRRALAFLMETYGDFYTLHETGKISGPFDISKFYRQIPPLAQELAERQRAKKRNDPKQYRDITEDGDFKAFLDLKAGNFAASVYTYIVKTGGEEEFFATKRNNSPVPLFELCKKVILAGMLAKMLASRADLGIGGRALAGPGVGGKDLSELGLAGLEEMFAGLPDLSRPEYNARNFGVALRNPNEPRGAAAARYVSNAPRPVFASYGPPYGRR